jgi:hypothetical protein
MGDDDLLGLFELFQSEDGDVERSLVPLVVGDHLTTDTIHPTQKENQPSNSTFHSSPRTHDSRLELFIGVTPNVILLDENLESIIDQRLGRVGRQRTSLLVRFLFASEPQGLGGLGAG